ncbi:hypothetical protein ACWCPO_30570 [Streptomyces albidoflavus]
MGQLVAVQVPRHRPATCPARPGAALKLAWPVLEMPPRKNQQSAVEDVR